MLVTLESLINDNINTSDEVIDMESLEFDIADTIMECSSINVDINTLVSASTVMENVQMEGFGEKIKNVFKIAVEKVLKFFKDVGHLIKQLALKIKYKFSDAKRKREILSKLDSEKQNIKISFVSWNPLISHILLNKIDEKALEFSNNNQTFKSIQFKAQQSFDNMITKTSNLFIEAHKGMDKDTIIKTMDDIIGEYPDILSDIEKYKKELYDIFGVYDDFKYGKIVHDNIANGEYRENISITYKELVDKIYYIHRIFDSLSASCDKHVIEATKDISVFTNKITVIKKELETDVMPVIPEVSLMRLLNTLEKFANTYKNLVLDITKFANLCNSAESSFSEIIKTVDACIKDFDNMNGEYKRGDVYIQA